jgi:hypothetical protein
MQQALRHLTFTTVLLGQVLPLPAGDEILFNRDIRPILADACLHCHGPDEAESKANLRLDTEAGAKADLGGYAAIVPGNPKDSALLARIRHNDPDEVMPPPSATQQLTEEQKTILEQWIVQGSAWQQHWAFEPPKKKSLPDVEDSKWIQNAIDVFVRARQESVNLAPQPQASKSTLIRRLSLDLTGLPPTPDEVEAFELDPSPDALQNLITRLFQSPRYGEQMAWQWLEAARYADTDGYQNDGPRDMWRWRDWVIAAYNRNIAFDQFTIEQLAGDLLPKATLEQVIATGFNRNHRYNSESGLVLEEFLLENAVDRVDTTSTVWMGLTAGCARCHDHKYDPISQREYYQLIAYFNNVPESGRAIKFGNSEPWVKAPTKQQQDHMATLQRDLNTAEEELNLQGQAIRMALTRWGPSVNHKERPLFQDKLGKRFPGDHAAGSTLEKVPGIICNSRFSVAFRMTPGSTEQGAVLSNETEGTGRNGILIEFIEGRLRFHIITRWIAGVATLETHQRFEPHQKVHVTVTNDGTQRAQGMRIFIDGVQAQSDILHNTNSNKSAQSFGAVFRVGKSAHVPPWLGTLHDLRFYNYTLTKQQTALLAEPESIVDIAAMRSDERTDRQASKLRQYYLEHTAPKKYASLALSVEKAREAYLNAQDALPTTMVMQESIERRATPIRNRGVYHQHGELVHRGVPDIFPSIPDDSPKNRLGFAQWLVSGKHPLTARVAVNRHWQLLFGRGLVKTPEDFGVQGSLPSHPELLDWLAIHFVESGWDVQQLLRTIVSSATYQQSSRLTPDLLRRDPDNILLARAPRRRLKGNALRDQALMVSGLLVEKQGGPSVRPYQPAKLWREASNFSYKIGKGVDLYRRSLYTYWKRTLAPPSMAILDTADREWCSVNLKKTNTPLQALTLLNETAFFEASRKLGERMLAHNDNADAQITWAFRAVTARAPSAEEHTVLLDAYHAYQQNFAADPAAAKRMLKVGQSKPNPESDAIQLAAATTLANVLLNLEEVTTRE